MSERPHTHVPGRKCWCGKIHDLDENDMGAFRLPPAVPPPVVTRHSPETEYEVARRLALEPREHVLVPFYIFQTFGEDPRNGRICEIIGRAGLDSSASEPQFKVVFNDGERDVCLSSELHPWYAAR